MKKSLWRNVFFLMFIVLGNLVNAQTVSFAKSVLEGTTTITDLTQIKSGNEFAQDGLSADQIDERIRSIIYSYLAKDIREYDLPINSKRLAYLGKKNPGAVFPIDKSLLAPGNVLNIIDGDKEIYKYDNIGIALADRSSKSLLKLHYLVRSLQIIKFRYPEAYRILFVADQKRELFRYLIPGYGVPNINEFTPLISFDPSPLVIAGSYYSNVGAPTAQFPVFNIMLYLNQQVGVTSIDFNKGGRPSQIYQTGDSTMDQAIYLHEGICETLVHEMVHQYINNFQWLDKKAKYIFSKRNEGDNFSLDVEECIVLNTTRNYFVKKGGLSNQLLDFYLQKSLVKQQIITDYSFTKNFRRFHELLAASYSGNSFFDNVYSLEIF